eukprot:jgi/Mesvir1/18651/Mv17153-RA.1
MLLLLRRCGLLSFPDFDLKFARTIFPFSVVWFVHIAAGVTSLRYLTVPTFAVLRRTTTPVLMLLELLFYRKFPALGGAVSVGIMLVGAMIASLNDLQFSLPGYLYTFLCVLMTALYLMYIPYLKKKLQATDAALLFYNNLMSLPVMLLYIVLATDELHDMAAYPHIGEPKFLLFLVVSCSQALLLNICIFHCTSVNSPLLTSVVGQLKDFLTTAIGLFIFGDVVFDFWNITGIMIGLIGGATYATNNFMNNPAYAKSREIISHSRKKGSQPWPPSAEQSGEIYPLLALSDDENSSPRPTAKAALSAWSASLSPRATSAPAPAPAPAPQVALSGPKPAVLPTGPPVPSVVPIVADGRN